MKQDLVSLIYQAAHIQRWNDHIRPNKGFTELDKQAHKMFYAYVIGHCEEERGQRVDWVRLIEGGVFEFFQRVVLTDIKPPIYHQLMAENGEELNRWVLLELSERLRGIDGGFWGRFERYLLENSSHTFERKILRAAHYLATNWEFGIIYNMNSTIYGVEDTKERIENELEDHYDLLGVQKLGLHRKTDKFLDMVGQLRFQQRWAQSPRVPETSVLGHMLVVAMLAYFCSLTLEASGKRLYNNFFAGLFHDLPEVLTRDIISPVKRSVRGLEDLIKRIEKRQMEERILPLLPRGWHQELSYFLDDEFSSKVMVDDEIVLCSSEEINQLYNKDSYMPLDGEIIRACDHLAAFLEAHLSITHGVTSPHLEQGRQLLATQYQDRVVAGVDFGSIYAQMITGIRPFS